MTFFVPEESEPGKDRNDELILDFFLKEMWRF